MRKGDRVTIQKTTETKEIFKMDDKMFSGCHNLRDMDGEIHYWHAWNKGVIIGYCATKVFDDFIFMARSGVLEGFRGNGLQKRMIKARERFHGDGMYITYSLPANPASTNSLISCGYKVYWPEEPYAGENMIYFMREIQ